MIGNEIPNKSRRNTMSDSEDSFKEAPKRRQKKRIRDDSSDEETSDDDDGNAKRDVGDDGIPSACDGVTLQQALVSLAGTPLSRNSRFVDILFKSCDS